MQLRPRRSLAAISILTLLLTGAVAIPASAQPSNDTIVASGEDWSVERAPGGYIVTLHLDDPLPVVSDAPTIVVDGEPLGIARTSDGGRILTITTFDERVASAREVEKGWASGSGPKAGEEGAGNVSHRSAPPPLNGVLQDQLDALTPAAPLPDPSDPGPYAVTEAEYDFGDRAIALAGYDNTRGEMVGKIYLSSAPGQRPVVVLEHGRHVTCGDSGTGDSESAWPCAAGQSVVRSYLGYEETARALASHGYDVVSVSANAINATDAELTLDQGAQARGRLVIDTLGMLDRLNHGETVAFEDRPDSDVPVTRTFDDALARAVARPDQPGPFSGLTATDLVGRFDLTRVGLMGHSRGGEGVVSAAQLNASADDQYGIVSVLPLAPTDFARRTLPDVTTAAVLPYCDGDVIDQQGQKYIDDSRHAFGDDVLRSAVWVMGANHNFFNSVWTPGAYPAGGADDWDTTDASSACATADPSRLSADEQYQVGVTLMTGFFRFTLGAEAQFQAFFDGSVAPTTDRVPFADIRVAASQARAETDLITDFVGSNAFILAEGNAAFEVCEGSMAMAENPSCSYRSDGQVPHWNPAMLASYVPLFPAMKFWWEEVDTAQLRVIVPDENRDVRDRSQLTVKVAPGDDVSLGTDFAITLVDGAGAEYSVLASTLNPYAINRMPGGAIPLDKIVLQQVTVPLSDVTGIDLADVREVRVEPRIGADGVEFGAVILSDLAFDSPAAGTPGTVIRPAVNMAMTRVDERAEPWTASVAVWLDRPSDEPITTYVGTMPAPGTDTPPAGLGAERVTFAPGETCLAVPVLIVGNEDPSGSAIAVAGIAATTSREAVSGTSDFSSILVREDDGVSGGDPVPPFGVQGDVCAELAASRTPGVLGLSDDEPVRGGTLRLTATGFRVGEAVIASFAGVPLPPVIAGADGVAVIETTIADDAPLGATAIAAVGAGSQRLQEATAVVRAAEPTPDPSSSSNVTAAPASSGTRPLASTGTDGGVWMVVVLLAALATGSGAAMTLEARRRRVSSVGR